MLVMVLSTIARLRPGRHPFSVIPRIDECLLLLAMVAERLLQRVLKTCYPECQSPKQVTAIVESVLIQKSVQHGLGKHQSGLDANDLNIYDKVKGSSQKRYKQNLTFASGDIREPTTLYHSPLSVQNVSGSVHQVLRGGSMGSCLVLGIAVCCRPLGCLDDISLSLSLPVTESVDCHIRQLYRPSE